MLITKIIELMQLRNRLNEEKRIIDRKLSVINNLIGTAQFINDYKDRQRRIKHDSEKYRNRKRFTQRT